jgi:hypothetical protein
MAPVPAGPAPLLGVLPPVLAAPPMAVLPPIAIIPPAALVPPVPIAPPLALAPPVPAAPPPPLLPPVAIIPPATFVPPVPIAPPLASAPPVPAAPPLPLLPPLAVPPDPAEVPPAAPPDAFPLVREVAIPPDPAAPPLAAPALVPVLVVPPMAFPPVPPTLVVPPAPTVPPEFWLPPEPLLPPKAPPVVVGASDLAAPSVEGVLTELPQLLSAREMALTSKRKCRVIQKCRMGERIHQVGEMAHQGSDETRHFTLPMLGSPTRSGEPFAGNTVKEPIPFPTPDTVGDAELMGRAVEGDSWRDRRPKPTQPACHQVPLYSPTAVSRYGTVLGVPAS